MDLTLKRQYPTKASALAFPLGGIGTGNISIGVRGNLRDWEIFNHPGKGVSNPNSFFAIGVRVGDRPRLTRILEGPVQPPYTEAQGFPPFTVSGLPHFHNVRFYGEYPFAKIVFRDPDIPLRVALVAYTPFIPLETEDSGLPCAIFSYKVTNLADEMASISLVGSLMNPIGEVTVNSLGEIVPDGIGQSRNRFLDAAGIRGIHLTSEGYEAADCKYGDLSLTTTSERVTYRTSWLRSGWYDDLREFWTDLSSDGLLNDPGYDSASPIGQNDTASLGIVDQLKPGMSGTYTFILSWYFPNRAKSWTRSCEDNIIRNHYAMKFASSWEVAAYVAVRFAYLDRKTREFHRVLYKSTLPKEISEALSANIVPLRSTTCFWHEDGNFYAYEGCAPEKGCCEGNCTHVWSYAQTLAYLFPDLERNMRLTEFTKETDEHGFMFFRAYKNFGEQFVWQWGDQKPEAAIDGQMGSILRVYREWQVGGDIEWLRQVWPGVKRAIGFVADHWDSDGDGLPDGRQHNTYDIEFYGPNPLGTIYYLAAMRAVQELAGVMGEGEIADNWRRQYLKASERADSALWNGEYYIQQLEDINRYKYQHGTGCLSDQLLGQLHAHILDLGYLLPPDHVRKAAESIYRHNFVQDFGRHENHQRAFAFNGESGLILCSWPHGGRPIQPFVYSDEVWTGVEYAVAALLIYEGMIEEGLAMVRVVRSRHDGVKRNPWNELECGNHYARSMASWAVLLAISGFHYSAHDHRIAFAPVFQRQNHRCFFSTGGSWGRYSQQIKDNEMVVKLEVLHGCLSIGSIRLHPTRPDANANAVVGATPVSVSCIRKPDSTLIQFEKLIDLHEGSNLRIVFL
jgi:uncharacterized protein (DUF608 family)